MPEKVKIMNPPTGLARLAFRIPLWFYRLGLGRLLGNRFLELTHTGRKSGLARKTVLEVVRFDPPSGIYYVAVGFGKRTDWYQNVLANPAVEVRSGGRHSQAIAVPLSAEEAGAELVRYSHQHPTAFRELARIMGYRVDGTDADTLQLGRSLPMFALKPDKREENGAEGDPFKAIDVKINSDRQLLGKNSPESDLRAGSGSSGR